MALLPTWCGRDIVVGPQPLTLVPAQAEHLVQSVALVQTRHYKPATQHTIKNSYSYLIFKWEVKLCCLKHITAVKMSVVVNQSKDHELWIAGTVTVFLKSDRNTAKTCYLGVDRCLVSSAGLFLYPVVGGLKNISHSSFGDRIMCPKEELGML